MNSSVSQALPYVVVAMCFIVIIVWNTRQRSRGIDTDKADTFLGFIITLCLSVSVMRWDTIGKHTMRFFMIVILILIVL